MSIAVYSRKVFCCPVHGLISFRLPEERLLVDLIGTRTFQRLRRISQLGVTSYVFHGAEHSRFGHSLGVCFLAKRILSALKERHRHACRIQEMIRRDEPAIKAASLLHDIGHGPFSHLFENVLNAPGGHEARTIRMISDPDSDIHAVLESFDKALPEQVACIINHEHDNPLAGDIVSSQLDADRLDYLLRDSLMTGTDHGRFDIEWLIRTLLAESCEGCESGEDSNERRSVKSRNIRLRLSVDGGKGVHAVEGYVLARHLMYLQVYFHKTGRAFEGQLMNILKFARFLLLSGDADFSHSCHPALRAVLMNECSDKDYLGIDDVVVKAAVDGWASYSGGGLRAMLAKACSDFYLERRPYNMIVLDENSYKGALEMLQHLDERLVSEGDPLRFSVHLDSPETSVYRSIQYSSASDRSAENTESIMISTDGRLVPVEMHPEAHLIRSLLNLSWQGRTLYFDHAAHRRLKSLFNSHGIIA